jgi:cytochrome c553
MSKIFRSPGLTRVLLLAAIGLVPVGLHVFTISPGMAHPFTSQDYGGQDPGGQDLPNLGPFDDEAMPRRLTKSKVARKKSRPAEKATTSKADSTAKTKSTGTKAKKGADTGQLKFSQDIAPILVADCIRCHSGDGVGIKKGKLDLSTFSNLQKGTPEHKVISAGNPEESSLVLRIKGEETPRMPQGANQVLSDDAIAKVERWVKQGAKLDTGIDPKKLIASYAANTEQVRRAEVAKLPQKERDKEVEAAGLRRWKQANPKLKPDVVSGDHFVIFSNLPRERALATLKVMEAQHGHLKRLLGAAASWVEKVSIYVFASRNDFIEFVRSVESHEVDADQVSSGMLSVAQPYVAVVDPLGGRKEEPGAGKRRTRTKRGEEGQGEGVLADRTLNGLLTEALGSSAVASAGNPPRWLAMGVGTFLAARVEPRSSHYHQLRQTALANYQQGWATKVNEALGGTDQITSDSLHAVGFALVEAMMSIEVSRRYFPAFVAGMLAGGDKLDDTLQKVFHGTREDFITDTGEWIAGHYGQLQ